MAAIQKITPFLWFNDNADEAVRFYTAIFPDSRVLQTTRYGDWGPQGRVMTVGFELCGQRFIALNGGPQFSFTEAISFMVYCESQAEIDRYWSALTAHGGRAVQCGWLKDRFGLSWQIVSTEIMELIQDPATSEKAMRALLPMVKLEIDAIRRAARG